MCIFYVFLCVLHVRFYSRINKLSSMPSDSLTFTCSIDYLITLYMDPVLCFVSILECDNHGFLCNIALVIVMAAFGCL